MAYVADRQLLLIQDHQKQPHDSRLDPESHVLFVTFIPAENKGEEAKARVAGTNGRVDERFPIDSTDGLAGTFH